MVYYTLENWWITLKPRDVKRTTLAVTGVEDLVVVFRSLEAVRKHVQKRLEAMPRHLTAPILYKASELFQHGESSDVVGGVVFQASPTRKNTETEIFFVAHKHAVQPMSSVLV